MLLLPISLVPLQNRSNCRTVLYLGVPPTGHHSLSSNGYCGHAVSHRKTRCVFFKPWGSNLSQFFRIQFKGVRLELLAPICKREKKRPAPFFLPEASLPALDGGVDSVQLFVTQWTIACQAPPSMEFFRQEYWSGLLYPPSGDLPNTVIKSASPTLRLDSLPLNHQGSSGEVYF